MSITNWENVEGWFDENDSKIYELAAQKFPDGSMFVEVGCWKGRSVLSMVDYLIKYKKKIEFFCVDHFEGSAEHQGDACILNSTLYQEYCKNIEPYKEYIQTMKMSSEEASLQFEYNSVDLVYIDASHDYENVSKDIDMWSKKVKPGGIISGHDWGCERVKEAVINFAKQNNYFIHNEPENSWHLYKR